MDNLKLRLLFAEQHFNVLSKTTEEKFSSNKLPRKGNKSAKITSTASTE